MGDVDKYAKEGVFKILVGNKCDLTEERQVPKIKGQQLADSFGIPFIETSAKSNENIDKLFENSNKALIDMEMKSGNVGIIQKNEPSEAQINLSAKKIKTKKKRKWC